MKALCTLHVFSLRRLRALCRKEITQILRDPSNGLIAFVIPVMLLFIFGYGINLDASKLRLGILLEQQSEEARVLFPTLLSNDLAFFSPIIVVTCPSVMTVIWHNEFLSVKTLLEK
jgi:hypothetical protein